MQPFRHSPIEMFRSAWRHRDLIVQLTKRDALGRYKGAWLGLLWSLLNPLLMLAALTFVFGVVFQSRWHQNESIATTDFSLILFVGLILHGFLAECLSRAPHLILSNINYVKKVVFPLDILPWSSTAASLLHTCIALLVWCAFSLTLRGYVPRTCAFMPLILAPLGMIGIGLTWWLASTSVYLRDIGQTTPFLATLLLFLSPVFYPSTALPARYQPWLSLNPLTFLIEQAREIMVFGRSPQWTGLALFFIASAAFAYSGFYWFQRTRRGFADVL